MAINELIGSGVELMLLGMGIVFGFLIVLVGVLRAMSALAAALSGTEPAAQAAAPTAAPAADGNLIAVIGAAVARYRADHRSA